MPRSIISIDPGTHSGIAVISISARPELLHNDVWNPSLSVTPTDIISDLVGYFDVMDACIEDQYLGKNANSMKILTRISGRWHEACCVRDLDVTWVSPRAWQTKILGAKWGSQRKQIDKMMKIIAQQDTQTKLTADQCAAWCIGKYHIFESHNRYVLQRSKPKMGR